MCERLVVQGGMAKVYHSVDQISKVCHSFDQIANLLPLFLPRVANQSTAKLAELLYSNLVPAPERLGHDWDEGDPPFPAQLLSDSALIVEGHCHCMTWRGG